VHQTTVPHFKLFHKPKPLSPDMKPLHDWTESTPEEIHDQNIRIQSQ
jgi:hypothetical protein